MSAPRQYRWTCKVCLNGVLAPERPRQDDVRRYCLPCSQVTGKLVRREAPALEAQRAQRAERNAAKAKAQRTRQREAREKAKALQAEREAAQYTIGGVDLRVEAKRLWNLPYLKEVRRKHKPGRTELPSFDWSQNRKQVTYATAWTTRNHVEMHIGNDPARTVGVLLHELVHCCLPYKTGHSDLFWTVLHGAARQAWPDAPFQFQTRTGSTVNERQWLISKALTDMQKAVAVSPSRYAGDTTV